MLDRWTKRPLAWGLGWLALAALGCSEESADFATFDDVQLAVTPETISFPALGVGQEAEQYLQILNLSATPAKLTIELRETATDQDQDQEFSWPASLQGTLAGEFELAPNGQVELPLLYKPLNPVRDEGQVIINSNSTSQPQIVIPVTTSDASADINGPTRLLFGRVPAGGHAQKSVAIQNIGSSPLTISNIELAEAGEFSFCFPPSASSTDCPTAAAAGLLPITLAPLDDILNIRVNYDPVNDGEDITVLRITSDDPDEGIFNVNLDANGSQPCIVVDQEGGFEFGTGFIGGVTTRTLTVRNCSPNKELTVDSIKLLDGSDPEFYLDTLPSPLPAAPLTIAVDGTANFLLNYAPESERTNTATIEIRSNDEAKSPLTIPVTARGSTNACPIAVAKAREVGTANVWRDNIETIPLATIQLSGEDSTDPDAPNDPNAISRYEWAIVERPGDSTTAFIPNATEPDPQLFLDLAGTYVIELRVFDRQGTPSCSASRVPIIATPNEDIHIQLVWDTPGDPDQTDSGTGKGADLDLHFLHPRGNWNAEPWDCYWLNPTENWASTESRDDPSLDIDDTDGSGPENINLNNPENVGYRVGAYYFSDHNFGPSYATIRIYLAQVLVFEYRDKYLERTGKFWDAATIEWGPNPRVGQVDQIYDGFP
jgi:hypothetical protein